MTCYGPCPACERPGGDESHTYVQGPPPCDTCGAPSTMQARDMFERPFTWANVPVVKEFDPGPWKYGCDAHPVASYRH